MEGITQKADGMNQTTNPSFDYGWVLQRNPRTFAGVDAAGRTMLVTVDGRQLGELGLSIPETAAAAKALGMRDAVNLDGGGSTAMVLDGTLVTHPPPTPPGSVRWVTRSTCADRRVSLRGTDRAGDGRGPSRGSHLGSSSVA